MNIQINLDVQANVNLDFDNKIGITPRVLADFFNLSFLQLLIEFGYLKLI